MDFYVRNFEFFPTTDDNHIAMFSNVGLSSSTDTAQSLIDVRYLKECYIYPAVYRTSGGDQANTRSTPASAELFRIVDSPSGDYYGEFNTGLVGDAARVLELYANSSLSISPPAYRFNPNQVWDNVGFVDPYANYTTFKTQICGAIKLSVDQYNELASINNFNVIIYKYEYDNSGSYQGQRVIVIYYPGNDPSYDDLISI